MDKRAVGPVFLSGGIEAETQQQELEMACTSPGEQSSAVADIARSDPVVELPGHGELEAEGREKGDDTGEELSDRSDAEDWEVVEEVREVVEKVHGVTEEVQPMAEEVHEVVEEVHEEEFVKTERIISTDDVVIPQNLPDPEQHVDTPPGTVEASLAEEELVQRVAVEEGEELREDGYTVIRRLTTMYHIRTEFLSPKFRGDEPRKVEKLLGTEVEEQITELAPGVRLPYDDDAEVETIWDESEDCLPDGTWIKKKTTRTTVHPAPGNTPVTDQPAVTSLPADETSFPPLDSESGLVDSGYRDLTEEEIAEEPEKTDLQTGKPVVEMMPELTSDLASREGMIHLGY